MNHHYGELPVSLGEFDIKSTEMMFYLYLPIKMRHTLLPTMEKRLQVFSDLIEAAGHDFIDLFGIRTYGDSYMYISAKRLFQAPGHSFNRPGWHSDGFLTDDINYVWCDRDPTVFNTSKYALTEHHEYSLSEMDKQSLIENQVKFKPNELLRLNQYNIHRVADVLQPGYRTFFKLSISKEKYNLVGNSHNYLLDYNWDVQERTEERNHTVKK